ncbi:MAG TPA: hypothetical protein VEA60_07320 [Allosphingosinicella sp.]|nr:hypothetical protein [Allosphingosinicella sp.]
MTDDRRASKSAEAAARRRYDALKVHEVSFERFLESERREALRLRELEANKSKRYVRGLPTMTPCGGGDFEKDIDPNEWQGGYGVVQGHPFPDPFVNFTGGLHPGPINAIMNPPHQTWVGAGMDPVVPIPTTPPGASGAARIGNVIADSGCDLLSKTFKVDAAHSLIGFWYAVVLQDYQDHALTARPYFWVRVADSATGAALPGCMDFGGGADRVYADINNPFFSSQSGTPGGFTPASPDDIVFKNWSFAQIDLSGHIGATVTLEFVTGDCVHNGHWGYAYIGNLCGRSEGSPEGSFAYDAEASSKCGKGRICFAYTLPRKENPATGGQVQGSVQITLDILQNGNGVPVAQLSSPVLTTGTHYCFDIDPPAIAGLDPSLQGFDVTATAQMMIGSTQLPPIKVGSAPDGLEPGLNNDYLVSCKVFSYPVKFVCGTQPDCDCACAPVLPGRYATEINIYNHGDKPAEIVKYVVPVVFGGAAAGREPRTVGPRAEDWITLPPYSATMDDCCRLSELLLGGPAQGPAPLNVGFLEIVSPVELTVTAVYTASGPDGGPVSLEVEQIEGRPRTAPPSPSGPPRRG